MLDEIENVVRDIRHDRLVQTMRELVGSVVSGNEDDLKVYYAAIDALEKDFYPGMSSREIVLTVLTADELGLT
jgi:hypothetical protein